MNRFVTFEGGEGCGKTTLINNLKNYLIKNNIDFVCTREPGGLDVCENIRNILKATPNLSAKTQLLLFSASRSHLVENVIKPSLDEGKLVLCDRFYDSSRIYQGYCGNISDEQVMLITNFATNKLCPAVTFYLDIDPKVAFLRKGGPDKGDVIENAGLKFHNNVRNGFINLAKNEKDRFVVIDATLPEMQVLDEVVKVLKEKEII